jgi:uncharacterized protein
MNKPLWDLIAHILVIIGGLNWGLVGLGYFFDANLNVVNLLFSGLLGLPVLEAIIYILVGIAAAVHIFTYRHDEI